MKKIFNRKESRIHPATKEVGFLRLQNHMRKKIIAMLTIVGIMSTLVGCGDSIKANGTGVSDNPTTTKTQSLIEKYTLSEEDLNEYYEMGMTDEDIEILLALAEQQGNGAIDFDNEEDISLADGVTLN